VEEEQDEGEDWLLAPQQSWLSFTTWLAGRGRALSSRGSSVDVQLKHAKKGSPTPTRACEDMSSHGESVQPSAPAQQGPAGSPEGALSVSNPIVKSRFGKLKSHILQVAPQAEGPQDGTTAVNDLSAQNHPSTINLTAHKSILPRLMTLPLQALLRECWGSDSQDHHNSKTATDAGSLWRSHRLLHPDSGFRGYWDMLTSFLIMYSVSGPYSKPPRSCLHYSFCLLLLYNRF
jgi:hypothetical protein